MIRLVVACGWCGKQLYEISEFRLGHCRHQRGKIVGAEPGEKNWILSKLEFCGTYIPKLNPIMNGDLEASSSHEWVAGTIELFKSGASAFGLIC